LTGLPERDVARISWRRPQDTPCLPKRPVGVLQPDAMPGRASVSVSRQDCPWQRGDPPPSGNGPAPVCSGRAPGAPGFRSRGVCRHSIWGNLRGRPGGRRIRD